MLIHTYWAARKGESQPELLVAWDEYTIDSYGSTEGFDKECRKARERMGDDFDEGRYIDIEISEGQLMQAFEAVLIDGIANGADDRG